MRPPALAVPAVAVALVVAPASAQQPDAARGEALAQKLCTFCHMPKPDAPRLQGVADVPTFTEIARREETTPERIQAKIMAPPHPMPPVALTIAEIADVAAFIQSLK